MGDLRKQIEKAINSECAENGSDTPDFILAEFLTDCLAAFDKALVVREKWYAREVGGWNSSPTGPAPPRIASEEEQAIFER